MSEFVRLPIRQILGNCRWWKLRIAITVTLFSAQHVRVQRAAIKASRREWPEWQRKSRLPGPEMMSIKEGRMRLSRMSCSLIRHTGPYLSADYHCMYDVE